MTHPVLRHFYPLPGLLVRVDYGPSEDVLAVKDDGSYHSLRGLPPCDAAEQAAMSMLDLYENGIRPATLGGWEDDLVDAARVLRGEHEVRCQHCEAPIGRSLCHSGWEHTSPDGQRLDARHDAMPAPVTEHDLFALAAPCDHPGCGEMIGHDGDHYCQCPDCHEPSAPTEEEVAYVREKHFGGAL